MSKGSKAPRDQGTSTKVVGSRRRRVFVRDLEIVASVGVLEHEKRYEQRIIISTDLFVRDDYDGVSDKLADVLVFG